MKTVQWQMQENFVFPKATGMPTGTETVKVTPRFTIDRKQESVQLTGIYHLAINVKLNKDITIESHVEDAILIDDVDHKGDTAYFEYAVPFNIDLPPEAHDPLNIVTANAVGELNGQGAIGIIWDVECSYREVVIVQKSTSETPKNESELKVEKKAIVETKKEAEAELKAVTEPKSKAKAEPKTEPKMETKSKANTEPKKEPKSKVKTETKVEEKVKAKKKEKTKATTENKPEPVLEKAPVPVVELSEEDAVAAAELILEKRSFNEEDEVLMFITGLDDDYSSKLFRSNDVSVKSES